MRIKIFTKLILFSLLCFTQVAMSQERTISGTVSTESGDVIVGATVIVEGTMNGISTDLDGKYTIGGVTEDSRIVFSYIGFTEQVIAVGSRTVLNVTMYEDAAALDEVVVIGYGQMRRSDVTAAISSVGGEELQTVATSNPMAALSGRVSGISIQKSSGLAGADVAVKIRGVNTFGSNAPLYIIDGFPGDIGTVNPADIANMQVLKDGAASAIYGSQAANGVVIITTKSGTSGATKVEFNAYLSSNVLSNKLDMLDADGYVSVQTQMYENGGVSLPSYLTTSSSVDTDWQDQVFQNGFTQNYSVSITSGSENINFASGYTYSDEQGTTVGNESQRHDAYVKGQVKFKKIFTLDAKIGFNMKQWSEPYVRLKEVYMMSPLVPVYNDVESEDIMEQYGLAGNYGLTGSNPVAEIENKSQTQTQFTVTPQVSLTVDFSDALSFRTGYSISDKNYRYIAHYNPYASSLQAPSYYSFNCDARSETLSQSFTNTLTFDKQFGKHSLNVLVGSQLDLEHYNYSYAAVDGYTFVDGVQVPAGFDDDSFETISAGAGGTYTANGYWTDYNRFGYFTRINYNYDDRYLVQATIRRDGSSYFGADNRWGTFPSLALAWRITQEDFFPTDTFVDDIKLRATYGTLGNEAALSPYSYESLMYSDTDDLSMNYVMGGTGWMGTYAPDLYNTNLQWETTESINVGADYQLFNGRLSGSLNWYQTTTRDLLISQVVPASAGVSDPIVNVGTIRNRGFEFEASWSDNIGELHYNVGVVAFTTSNEVLELASEGQQLTGDGLNYGTSHYPNLTQVGSSIGAFYLYKTDGIFQSDAEAAAYTSSDGSMIQPNAKAGDIKFVDKNGDGTIDDSDRYDMGSGIASLEASFSLGLAWRNFDFNALVGSSWGASIYNGNRYLYEAMASSSNMLSSTLDAWTPTNTDTDVPRAVYGDPNSNAENPSDRFLEDGDFIRLRQIQLGYTLPSSVAKKLSVNSVRVYLSGDNLLTWTKYSGIDPEFGNTSSDATYGVLSTGVDNLIYPFYKSYIAGIQITF
ncbi:MAG: TonB-dependent receptor [Rikenellaceae bacterium]